jgi:hypothetical protein
MSLARLRHDQGKRDEAHDLLAVAPVAAIRDTRSVPSFQRTRLRPSFHPSFSMPCLNALARSSPPGVAMHLIVRMRSFRPWWAFNCENLEVWDSQINWFSLILCDGLDWTFSEL